MPRIIETTVYGIEELSDRAKEAARFWYRETCLDHEWYDFVYEDFETICRILGIALRAKGIRAHAPQDTELHRIADTLQEAQRRNFFQLHTTIRQRGNYCHEYGMAIEVERDTPTWQPPTDGAEDVVTEALPNLACWLYRQLRSEYEHQTSDAVVDEVISGSDWAFTADGRRFG